MSEKRQEAMLQPESSNITRHFAFRFMIGFWIMLGLIDLLKSLVYTANAGKTFDWAGSLQFVVIYTLAWIVLSIPIYRLFRKTSQSGWRMSIFYHSVGSILFGGLHTIITSCTFVLCQLAPDIGSGFWEFYITRMAGSFFPAWLDRVLTYWMVAIILLAFDYYDKFRKQSTLALHLESELSQAQLQALRMQVQPHFLFNSHNTIAMLIRRGKYDAAVDMISGLSDMLRTSLMQNDNQFITLREEVDLIGKYLNIEQARFEGRLTIRLQIDEQVNSALLPSLILQPLVENAIKHGVSREMTAAELLISATRQDDRLVISIYNSGPALPEEWALSGGEGIGLQNVQRRLQNLFPGVSTLSLENSRNGVEARLSMPFSLKKEH